MGIPDHLTCLLRNLYAGQEATVRIGHGTTDWFQIGKGVHQGCILLPCLFNLYADYIMRNTGLEEAQAGMKISGRNINNLRYADDTTLMAESEEELKRLLMKVKEESEKVGLKVNIQKTKIMASGPITSWEVDRETVETVSDFILGVSKITADGDCSNEIKRRLLLGRKVMTDIDSIFKSRDITLPTKVRLVKAMVFPVVMYGCEGWTVKKAECRRIDAFVYFLLLLLLLYYFTIIIIYFTILYWFCHTSTCICHGCTRVPHPEPPSDLPPHTSAPAPSFLYPASNLDWRLVSYMILYMFQCYSPKSSTPLPQSPEDRLYICVSFAVSHTGLSLPSF